METPRASLEWIVEIVNEEFVRQFLAGPRAVGVRLGRQYEGDSGPETEIVGVVGDVLKDGNDTARQPELYFVHGPRSHRITSFPTFVVRGPGSQRDLVAALRSLVTRSTAAQRSTPSRLCTRWCLPRGRNRASPLP